MKKSNCSLICSVLAIMLLVCSCGNGTGGGGPSGTLTLSIMSAHGPTTPSIGVHYCSPGESVTISAPSTISGSAGTRYVCTGWSSGSGDIPSTGTATSYGPFTITQNCIIAWTWKNQYQLTTTVSSQGRGTITRSPDITWYDQGTTVTLTANANTGFRFTAWSGNLSGTTNPASLTMSGVRRVTGTFIVLIFRTVTVSSPYGVPTPPVGETIYTDGDSVTVSCGTTPYPGLPGTRYVCTGWTGGSGNIPLTGGFSERFETGNISGWTTGGNASWSATTDNKHSGTYSARSGGITHNQNTYIQRAFTIGAGGETVTFWWKVSSEPNSDYLRFYVDEQQQAEISGATDWAQITYQLAAGTRTLKWEYSKNSSGSSGSDRGWIDDITVPATSYTFTITQNCTITWTWKTQYPLATSVNPPGGGTMTPSADWYDAGTLLSCTATASPGYTFLGWSGGFLVGSDNPQNLTMNGPKTVMANFQSIIYYITVGCIPAVGKPDPPVGTTPHPGGIPITVSCGTTPFYGTFTEGFEQVMSDSWVTGSQVAHISNDKHSGSCSVTLGAVGDNRYSYIERTFTLTGDGTVTFWWKVSSQDGDCLRFYIDGLECAAISGQPADWALATFPLAAGISTLRWAYTKNSSGTSGSDCGWIDDIAVTNATLAEGFEAGSISGWTNGGNATWSVTDIEKYSGTYSARSGNIANNGSSYIERTLTIGAGGGTVTFWWKVSSEPNYDWLKFYIDGALVIRSAGPPIVYERISGEVDWTYVSYPLAAGSRTLRWSYMKNASNTQNSDCGWIDDITVTSATFNEGFESGITSGWATRGSTIEWPITDSEKHSGTYSARSGNIADNQSTYIERTFTIGAGGGTLAFWWKVSSEIDGDYLRFYVDGQQQAEISGETVWAQITYQLAAGTRTLRWSYVKNASTAQNSDCGWIDDIEITNSPASKTRYACTGWMRGSGNIPATGSQTFCMFTITQDSAITWTWGTQYQLTTAVNPPNSGSVTPGSGGWYNENSVVSCSAYPYSYHWVGWRGDPVYNPDAPNTPETVQITMNGPKNIIADFLRPTLTVSNPQGYDAPNPVSGEYSYDYDTPVTCSVTSPTVCSTFNEGFEAGAISGWTLGTTDPATANWFVTASHKHSGTFSARSGAIPDSVRASGSQPARISTTYIERTFTVAEGGGTLTFWWKVSSQPNDDYLRFYIDGSEQAPAISSVVDWELRTFPLAAGARTLRWTYVKGYETAQYFDCGWIDDISVTNIPAAPANTRYLCTGYTGTGNLAGGGSTSSVTFAITQDSSVTWTWQTQYYLSVSVLPVIPAVPPVIGGTALPTSNWYAANTDVTEIATPNGGFFTFTNWTGDVSSTDNLLTVTMNAPKSITANFTILNPVPLVVTPPSPGSIPPGGTTYYPYGCPITISCGTTPYSGGAGVQYVCTGWTGGYGDISSTGNATSVTFTITQGSGLTWSWKTQYQLTTSVNPAGRGSVLLTPSPEAGGWYDAGTPVSCSATPASTAWLWSNWSGDLTGTENPKALTMNGPKSITANFTRPTLTVSNPGDYDTPSPAVGTHAYDYNSSVTCSVSSPAFATTAGTFTTEQFEGGMNQWWLTGGAQWRVTYLEKHSGTYSARSGVIGDYENADIEREFTIGAGGGQVTFWWKVSSEQYDYLEFYIDDHLQAGHISGEQNWTQMTFSLAAGTRTLKWRYRKDYSVAEGSDCGWIDDISVTNTTSGTFTEGFEQGISTLWVTGANVNWYLTNAESRSGAYSARSGAIGDRQSTYIERTFTIGEAGGTVTFWWKVSCSDGWRNYDCLEFWIDNERQVYISGDVVWEQRTFSLAPGARTLRWRYMKDWNTVAGQDCGWIDDIQVTNTVLPYTNYVCIGWTGGSGNIPATGTATSCGPFAITQDSTITWNWKTIYRLTVNVAPPEGGTVNVEPSSPDGYYDVGSIVTLTASGTAPYTFSFWSGDLTGTDFVQHLTMDGPKSVTANFRSTPYTLTVSSAHGSPDPSAGSSTYLGGTPVTCSVSSPSTDLPLTTPVEGFEEGDISGWTTGGSANWFATDSEKHSGTYSARSGDIGNSQNSYIERTFTAGENGAVVTFWWKVSSEGPPYTYLSYDFLEFYINGVRQDRISGEVGWQPGTCFLDPGTTTLRWTYIKDEAEAEGSDCGWIDDISFFADVSPQRYVCTGWVGGSGDIPPIGTENSYSFIVRHNSSITWTWTTQYLLKTSVTPVYPVVGGTVTRLPAGAGGLGRHAYYDSGTSVQLTGNPNAGFAFRNWSGDLGGTDNPKTVIVNAPRSLTANFSILIPRVVTVTSARSEPSPPAGATSYPDNYPAPLSCGTTPYPVGATGTRYVCTGWAGGSGDISPTGTATFYTIPAITRDSTITWMWKTQYQLTTAVNPAGGGSVVPTTGAWYDSGASVDLTATPNTGAGFRFDNWSGDLTGSTNPKTLIMNGPKSVTANFSYIGCTLTVTSAYGVPDPPAGTHAYVSGTLVTCSVPQITTAPPLTILNDGFGTGKASSWTTGGDAEWYVTNAEKHSGSYSARSGAIGNSQSTYIERTVTAGENGATLTFWWKVSSEPGCDYLRFYIDGSEQAAISGVVDWGSRTFSLAAGNRTLGWIYAKNASGSQDSDCGWIDDITVTNIPATSANTQYVCTGWTGGSGSIPATGSGTSCTFAITQNSAITWTWKTQYYLTTSVSPVFPPDSGIVARSPNSIWYDAGTNVQLTATASAGFAFANWSGDLSGAENPKSLTMDGPKSVTANFAISTPRTITVASDHGAPNPPVGTHTYPDGYSVTVSCGTTPYAGPAGTRYDCTGWTGGSGNITPSEGAGISYGPFTITQDSTITWTWKTQYYLTTSVSPVFPPDSGTVARSPDSIWYDAGTNVQLTATASAVFAFANWSGDLSSINNPETVTIDAPKNITANFTVLDPRTITVTSPYSSPSPPIGVTACPNGKSVTVSCGQTPYPGSAGTQYLCTGWTGGSGDILATGTATSYGPFTITQNCTITWTWKTQYQLTTSVNPVGRGSVTPASGNWYDAGTVVSCSATPNTDWVWAGWNGDLSGTDRPKAITMDGPKSITANFTTPVPRVVTVASVYGAPDPPVGQNTYLGGSAVTVSCGQTPYPGPAGTQYICTGWTGGSGDIPPTGATAFYTIPAITQDCTITWTWKTQYYLTTLVAPVFPARGGTVTRVLDANWYDVDVSVELTAVANLGFAFSSWSGDLSGTENPKSLTMDAPKSVTANFMILTPRVVTVTSTRGEPIPPVGATSCPEGYPVPLSCGQMPYPGPAGTQYVCTGWMNGSGDVPLSRSATFYTIPAITQNSGITWVWQTQYQLTTSVSPAEGGSVTPPSWNWFNSGTVVSCNATEAVNYGFVNWSGDLSGTERPTNVTMNGPRNIIANFIMPTLTVYNPSGYDTPNPPAGTQSCNYGASVTCSVTSPWFWTTPPPGFTIFSGSFDAGNLSDWTTGGDANWSATNAEKHDGTFSARSGAIGDSGTTYIQKILTGNLTIPAGGGILTFWWNVYSEPNYDFLEFYIDGVRKDRISGYAAAHEETPEGPLGWTQRTYLLDAGIRTLRWRYTKDVSDAKGSDCGWVDTVLVTGTPNTQYVCTGYAGTGSCPNGTESSVTFIITQNSSITWNWKTQHRLIIVTNPMGGGIVDITPSDSSYYDEDTPLTLTANAVVLYEFGNWSGGLTGTDNPQYLIMDTSKTVTANFIGPTKPANLTGTANSASAITWSWTGNSDWQAIAAGVLRTIAATLSTFQTTYGDLPASEPCPRTGTGNDRLLFEASDDLPDTEGVQDCPTISAASAQTYTITYTRTDALHWTCTADTDRTDLKDLYIDDTGALLEAPSTGDGPQANSSSPISPDNVWFEIQDSAHTRLNANTIYPNITSYQETDLSENTQYTRHVHAVNYGVYSDPTNDASRYTLVHNANTTDFTPVVGSSASNRGIGSGNYAKKYPIDISYNYARCQMIFVASEIGSAGVISRIRFQRASGDADTVNNAKVYIVQTTQSELTGWVNTSNHTEVFSGNLTVPADAAGTWFEIPLRTPFGYDGSRNIIISFRHQDGAKEGAYTTWRNHTTSGAPYPQNYYHRAVAGVSDTNPDPPVSFCLYDDNTGIYIRPNVQFEFGGTVAITVAAPPNNPTVGSTGVRIERAPSNSFTPAQTVVIQPFAATYARTDSVGSGTWWYRIRFRNADGIESAYSPGRDVTIPAP